jgi:hypothetical protein
LRHIIGSVAVCRCSRATSATFSVRSLTRFAFRLPCAYTGWAMFSEDVVLGGLKAEPSWFISDRLLLMDSRNGSAEDVARQIAARNDLRCERSKVDRKPGFRSTGSSEPPFIEPGKKQTQDPSTPVSKTRVQTERFCQYLRSRMGNLPSVPEFSSPNSQ